MTVLNSKVLRRCKIALVLPALLGTLGATAVKAASCPEINPEALRWLDKMSHSAQEVSYEGVVTFQRGENMQVMQISHQVSDGAAS